MRPLVERRQGRCVLSRGICRNSTEWASRHIRSHNRLGGARASPGRLACSGIDQGRDPPRACTRNSASCMGPRPRSMQNTIEDSARVSQSLVPTPILRMNGLMKNGSILMKISLATRDTTIDPPSSVQRPEGSTVLGHRGRSPGHQGHPGTNRRGDQLEESRIPPAITTTMTLPPTTGSTNLGSRMPRGRKLLLERPSPTPTTTMTTMNPGHSTPGPTTRRIMRKTPHKVGRHRCPVTILCRSQNRCGSRITCRNTTMKSRPSINSDTLVRSE